MLQAKCMKSRTALENSPAMKHTHNSSTPRKYKGLIHNKLQMLDSLQAFVGETMGADVDISDESESISNDQAMKEELRTERTCGSGSSLSNDHLGDDDVKEGATGRNGGLHGRRSARGGSTLFCIGKPSVAISQAISSRPDKRADGRGCG